MVAYHDSSLAGMPAVGVDCWTANKYFQNIRACRCTRLVCLRGPGRGCTRSSNCDDPLTDRICRGRRRRQDVRRAVRRRPQRVVVLSETVHLAVISFVPQTRKVRSATVDRERKSPVELTK
jgi:hypothetical protein